MNKIYRIGLGLCSIIGLAAVSCGKLDVVGTDSVRAFGDMLKALPPDAAASGGGGNWSISAPDKSARFMWTSEGAAIIFDITPFVNAGLDVSAFDSIRNGVMVIGRVSSTAGQEPADPLEDFAGIVKTRRGTIGYHGALDHYGVNLGSGNLFEWAKDMRTNDKDIVFVLDPEPFITAGADPARIEGWTFAKVTVDNENGKPVQVDKILKPFNLL